MSQQHQDIAQLLAWISARSNNDKALIRNGINALLDLVDPALQHDPDEDAGQLNPHDPVAEQEVLTSSTAAPSPGLTIPDQQHPYEADWDVSSFSLSSALQGTVIPAEARDIEHHRALTMDRLEGRDIADPQSALRARAWVLEQGTTTGGLEQGATTEAQPMHCFISLIPSAPKTHRPLHHAQGLANLRQVAEEQQSSTKSSNALVEAPVEARSSATSSAQTPSGANADHMQLPQRVANEVSINDETESHGSIQAAPAVASPVPMYTDKGTRRGTWRARKTRSFRAKIREQYHELKHAIVRK